MVGSDVPGGPAAIRIRGYCRRETESQLQNAFSYAVGRGRPTLPLRSISLLPIALPLTCLDVVVTAAQTRFSL
jgi:hypothetical protein